MLGSAAPGEAGLGLVLLCPSLEVLREGEIAALLLLQTHSFDLLLWGPGLMLGAGWGCAGGVPSRKGCSLALCEARLFSAA